MMAAIGGIIKIHFAGLDSLFVKQYIAIVAAFKPGGFAAAGKCQQVLYGIIARCAYNFNYSPGSLLFINYGHAVAALQVAYQLRMAAGNEEYGACKAEDTFHDGLVQVLGMQLR